MSLPTEPRYTCEIIFHRTTNVPIADLNNLSSDPCLDANLSPLSITGSDRALSFRTQTIRKTLSPTLSNARWLVSGVPASGLSLIIWLMDEDPGNYDDKLGKAVIPIPGPEDPSPLKEGWDTGEREYKIHKRYGGLGTRINTYVSKLITQGPMRHPVRVYVSVRVLGPAPRMEGDDGNRLYTLGPHIFVRHFSPLAARLAWVQSFTATRLQLAGPVPSELCHRYVGFRPFIKAMFRAKGIEGLVLNRALHHQHSAIYKWDKETVWGVTGTGEETEDVPDEAFARKFLDLVEHGTNGRVFTYVIMLDGQFRFTETGDEFAIQFLSKHTMHSDVSVEIAYSGEFFTDRIDSSPKSLPPSAYELVIDNDSGTYRPRKELLPVLEAFLARPSNLGALGRICAIDGFDQRLSRWKEERKEEKRKAQAPAKGKISSSGVS